MNKKRKKYSTYRSTIPAWVDTLIAWLEVVGVIGLILSAIYSIYSLGTMIW